MSPSRLKTIAQGELERELEQRGADWFHANHACPFLVVVYSPPAEDSSDDDIGERTLRTDVGDLNVSLEHAPSKQLVPVRGSPDKADKQTVTLGRDSDNDIVIRSSKVSRRHAEFIMARHGKYELRDLDSANGTRINGSRLPGKKAITIKSGDMLAFWRFLFQFVEPEAMLALLRKPAAGRKK